MPVVAAREAGRSDRCTALTRCLRGVGAMTRPLAICACSPKEKENAASVERQFSGGTSWTKFVIRQRDRTMYTVSGDTAGDALLQLARGRSLEGKKVCALHFASGEVVGEGCLLGAREQTQERRWRCLAFRRRHSNADALSTGTSRQAPSAGQYWQRYADALFAPRRQSRSCSWAESGKSVGPSWAQDGMALVSAAATDLPKGFALVCRQLPAPSLGDSEELRREHLLESIRTVITTPRLKDRAIDTLVLSALGCGACGCDPAVVAALFAEVLQGEGIGRLYREVHFVVPSIVGASGQAFTGALEASGLSLERVGSDLS